MRLLNTKSYRLHEFDEQEVPDYAILSHRWEEEEVVFQDLIEGGNISKKGTVKLKGCCNQARKDGYKWVWVDSCCIEKSSSAELSEAINSMFNWYLHAKVCYAYLSDVPDIRGSPKVLEIDDSLQTVYFHQNSYFHRSKWFTRGWTLQELLAPEHLIFFNKDWVPLGSKFELEAEVSTITGIRDLRNFRQASVAQKMSWASRRETTRMEDRAYSLLGLFGVNMPPIYGEQGNAFLRLQQEILKISDDESIFAWQDLDDLSGGLLARSPTAFMNSGSYRRLDFDAGRPAYMMTNKGLRMEAHLLGTVDPGYGDKKVDDSFLVGLNCDIPEGRRSTKGKRIGIMLRRLAGDQFSRMYTGRLFTFPSDPLNGIIRFERGLSMSQGEYPERTVFHVKQRDNTDYPFRGPYNFAIETLNLNQKGFYVSKRYLTKEFRSRWEEGIVGGERLTTDTLSSFGMTAALLFTPIRGPAGRERFLLVVNVCRHTARVAIIAPEDDETLDEIEDRLIRIDGIGFTPDTFKKTLSSGREVNVSMIRKEDEYYRQLYAVQIVL